MKIKLNLILPDGTLKQLEPLMFPFIIGRDKKQCNFSIDDVYLSSKHLEINFNPDSNAFMLKDLETTNGTKLNGVRIKESVLKDLDVIILGRARITVEIKSEKTPVVETQKQVLPVQSDNRVVPIPHAHQPPAPSVKESHKLKVVIPIIGAVIVLFVATYFIGRSLLDTMRAKEGEHREGTTNQSNTERIEEEKQVVFCRFEDVDFVETSKLKMWMPSKNNFLQLSIDRLNFYSGQSSLMFIEKSDSSQSEFCSLAYTEKFSMNNKLKKIVSLKTKGASNKGIVCLRFVFFTNNNVLTSINRGILNTSTEWVEKSFEMPCIKDAKNFSVEILFQKGFEKFWIDDFEVTETKEESEQLWSKISLESNFFVDSYGNCIISIPKTNDVVSYGFDYSTYGYNTLWNLGKMKKNLLSDYNLYAETEIFLSPPALKSQLKINTLVLTNKQGVSIDYFITQDELDEFPLTFAIFHNQQFEPVISNNPSKVFFENVGLKKIDFTFQGNVKIRYENNRSMIIWYLSKGETKLNVEIAVAESERYDEQIETILKEAEEAEKIGDLAAALYYYEAKLLVQYGNHPTVQKLNIRERISNINKKGDMILDKLYEEYTNLKKDDENFSTKLMDFRNNIIDVLEKTHGLECEKKIRELLLSVDEQLANVRKSKSFFEKKASELLLLAEDAFAKKNFLTAEIYCKNILEQYPDTDSAESAKNLLKKIENAYK